MKFNKPVREVDRVFIHCSASDNPKHDNIKTIKEWHLARGFKDIGYHYFIHKNGSLSIGRDVEITPAAQAGHNTGTIAICLHGLEAENFTDAQFGTLRMLCENINDEYRGNVTFHGHCEVSPKPCPVFDYKRVLGLDRDGHL